MAVMADVEAMFHQVKVPDEDSDLVGTTAAEDQGDAVLELMQFFSSWIHLQAVAWMLEIKSTLLSVCQKTKNTTLAPTEVDKEIRNFKAVFYFILFYFICIYLFNCKVSIRRVILCYCHFKRVGLLSTQRCLAQLRLN